MLRISKRESDTFNILKDTELVQNSGADVKDQLYLLVEWWNIHKELNVPISGELNVPCLLLYHMFSLAQKLQNESQNINQKFQKVNQKWAVEIFTPMLASCLKRGREKIGKVAQTSKREILKEKLYQLSMNRRKLKKHLLVQTVTEIIFLQKI